MIQRDLYNTPRIGMNTDATPDELQPTEYTFAKNAILNNDHGSGRLKVQNEPSNLLNTVLEDGFVVVGREYSVLDNRLYLLLKNPQTEVSVIGYTPIHTELLQEDERLTDEETGLTYEEVGELLEEIVQEPQQEFVELLNDDCNFCLDFSLTRPFKEGQIVFKREACGVVMYFCDDYHPDRRFEVDNPDWYKTIDPDPCEGGQPEEVCVNCQKLLLTPTYSRPCVTPLKIAEGGNLLPGTYEACVAGCDRNGIVYTPYYGNTRKVTIYNRNKPIKDEDTLNERTNLGILFQVEWDDPNIRYYKVVITQTDLQQGVIHYIEGIHPISDKNIQLSTEADKEIVPIEEIYRVPPVVLHSRLMATSNGYLFRGGATMVKEMNLQPVALILGAFLEWQSVEADEALYADGALDALYGSAFRDETYCYAIRFSSSKGYQTAAFPLAGRPSQGNDKSVISDLNVQSIRAYQNECFENTRLYNYQFKNTATDTGANPADTIEYDGETFINEKCTVSPYRKGKFAYVESTETYPDNDELYNASLLKYDPSTLPGSIASDFNSWFGGGGSDEDGNVFLGEGANFKCQPIRHFKYPDNLISPFMGETSLGEFRRCKIYPIGLLMDEEVIMFCLRMAVTSGLITEEQFEEIDGFEILIGDRTLHKSIIAKGVGFDLFKYTDSKGEDVWYPNYPYNDLRNDQLHYVSRDSQTIISHPYGGSGNCRYTFHSPDTHFRTPNLPTEVVIDGYQRGNTRGVFAQVEGHSKWVILSSNAYTLATSLALAEALFNVLGKYADYRMDQIANAPHTHRYGFEGKVWKRTDLVFNLALDLSTGPITDTNGGFQLAGASGPVTGIIAPIVLSSEEGYLRNADGDDPDTNPLNYEDFGDYDVTVSPGIPIIGDPSASLVGTRGLRMRGYVESIDKLSTAEKALILAGIIQGVMSDYSESRQKWLQIFKDYGDPVNFGYYYTSEGFYNQFVKNTQTDSYLRYITAGKYMPEGMFRIPEGLSSSGIRVNNINRESSVYLSTTEGAATTYRINYPGTVTGVDNSRTTAGEENNYTNDSGEITKNTIVPYMTLRQYNPGQYGTLNSIKWLPTGYCSKLGQRQYHRVFGGDARISRMSLKRKIPFYLNYTFRQDRLPFNYKAYDNIGGNVFDINYDYAEIDTSVPSNPILAALLALVTLGFTIADPATPERKSDYNFDTFTSRGEYIREYSKIYLYYYGIPQFLTETEVNTNYRYAGRLPAQYFYEQVGDYRRWTQEEYVSIREDNQYLYSGVYSTMPMVTNGLTLPSDFDQEEFDCRYDLLNGVLYSPQDNTEQDLTDPWRILRPNDFYRFPSRYGKLIRLKGIESNQVIAMFQNELTVYNAVDELQDRTSPSDNILGTGHIFTRRPVEFYDSDTGYSGCQHSTLLSTPIGHFYVDATRGKVMHLGPNGQSLDSVTANKTAWFAEHLPFKILRGGIKNFTDLDVDDCYNHLGISLGWNSKLDSLLLTKLDYMVNEDYIDGIYYRNGNFYLGEEVPENEEDDENPISVTDEEYFTNVSFTMSYYPQYQGWGSYHSYIPNYYVSHPNGYSIGFNIGNPNGLEQSSIWQHHRTQQSFGVFQNNFYPFEIEFPSRETNYNNELSSVEYWVDCRRYKDYRKYASLTNISFDEVFIYNDTETTGRMELIPERPNSRRQWLEYPAVTDDSLQILTTCRQKSWSFNSIYNRVLDHNVNISQLIIDENEIDIVPNDEIINYNLRMKDRLRGDYFLSRFKLLKSPYRFTLRWFKESVQTP